MITFEDAVTLVRDKYPEFDQWIEYDDAWVFGVSGPASFGGSRSPIAVFKEDGAMMAYPSFVAEHPGQKALDEGELE